MVGLTHVHEPAGEQDLVDALRRQAQAAAPRSDLTDVVARARAVRRRHTAVRAGAVIAALAAAVVVAVPLVHSRPAVVDSGPAATVPPVGTTRELVDPSIIATNVDAVAELPGLLIGGTTSDPTWWPSLLDRVDSTATAGPWTVGLRRGNGTFGSGGAVVVWPVDEPIAGDPTTVGAVRGKAGDGQLAWPLAGRWASVRGDGGPAVLQAIAGATQITGNLLSVGGTMGYASVYSEPFRAPVVHEARYGSEEVDESHTLGGLTYTGTLRAGGFEYVLYGLRAAGSSTRAVHGAPAYVTTMQGGNATLAWELAPGTVAYVGYSGAALTSDTEAALSRLADRTAPVPGAVWDARRPQQSEQLNDFP